MFSVSHNTSLVPTPITAHRFLMSRWRRGTALRYAHQHVEGAVHRLVFAGIILFGTVEPCAAASFDCSKASSSVERLICANQDLSELDERLATEYQKRLEWAADLDKRAAKKLEQDGRWSQESQTRIRQRDWLKLERNSCVSVDCLKATYLARLSDFDSRQAANEGGARFDLLPISPTISKHVLGVYTQMTDLTSVSADGTGFEKIGEHEDYVKIFDAENGKANVELWLTFANGHLCRLEGIGAWRENHIEVYEESDLYDQPCRLRLYSDGKEVLLRDPGGICTRMSCGARGWLDRSKLKKNVR